MNMNRLITALGSTSFTLFLSFGLAEAPLAIAQPPAGGAPSAAPTAPINRPPDPRVQQRKYHFADTNEDLPYALFVSSKVTTTKKAPLIVALQGYGGDGNSLLRGTHSTSRNRADTLWWARRVTTPWAGTARR